MVNGIVDGAYIGFRPIYILFILLLVCSLFAMAFFKRKIINGFTVISFSVTFLFVSALLLYQTGIIVDELGIGGDPISFVMFIAIACLALFNPIYYYRRYRNV
ncbi:hypothetical protein ABE099_11725 [Paenibacillus turicensis]|uniref:hypothetical protein n=1 Tax=Paenibacillus turicensis TaxID=160487 RepID=UPI003D2E124C